MYVLSFYYITDIHVLQKCIIIVNSSIISWRNSGILWTLVLNIWSFTFCTWCNIWLLLQYLWYMIIKIGGLLNSKILFTTVQKKVFTRFCLIWHNLWNYLGDYETFVLQITSFINRLPNLTKPMSYACMFLEMEIFFRIVYYFLVPLLFLWMKCVTKFLNKTHYM